MTRELWLSIGSAVGKIVRVLIPESNDPLALLSRITSYSFAGAGPINAIAYDTTNKKIYAVTGDSPAKGLEIDPFQYTEEATSSSLGFDIQSFCRSFTGSEFSYFGLTSSPARVAKVVNGTSLLFSILGSTDADDVDLIQLVVDDANDIGFFTTNGVTATNKGPRLVKFKPSTMQRLSHAVLPDTADTASDAWRALTLDVSNGHVYAVRSGISVGAPAVAYKFNTSDLSQVGGGVTLTGVTQPAVVRGSNPFPVNGFMYVFSNAVGSIAKVNISHPTFSFVTTLAAGSLGSFIGSDGGSFMWADSGTVPSVIQKIEISPGFAVSVTSGTVDSGASRSLEMRSAFDLTNGFIYVAPATTGSVWRLRTNFTAGETPTLVASHSGGPNTFCGLDSERGLYVGSGVGGGGNDVVIRLVPSFVSTTTIAFTGNDYKAIVLDSANNRGYAAGGSAAAPYVSSFAMSPYAHIASTPLPSAHGSVTTLAYNSSTGNLYAGTSGGFLNRLTIVGGVPTLQATITFGNLTAFGSIVLDPTGNVGYGFGNQSPGVVAAFRQSPLEELGSFKETSASFYVSSALNASNRYVYSVAKNGTSSFVVRTQVDPSTCLFTTAAKVDFTRIVTNNSGQVVVSNSGHVVVTNPPTGLTAGACP